MPIVTLPNGQSVNFEEGTPDEVIQNVMRQTAPSPGQPLKVAVGPDGPPAPIDPIEQAINKRVASSKKRSIPGLASLTAGMGSSFDDELIGGLSSLSAIPAAIKNRSFQPIKDEYNIARGTAQRQLTDERESAPAGSTFNEIAGALMNPIGAGGKALQAAGRFAPKLAKAGKWLEDAPALVRGVAAGANQGAVNAAGSSDGFADRINSGATGAVVGGATGGALGTVVHGGQRAIQSAVDHMPKNAGRTAYDEIAQLLGGKSPESVERELASSRRLGTDARVLDTSPGLQAVGAMIARRPKIPGSRSLVELGENRMAGRRDLLESKIREGINPATGQDAMALEDVVTAARKTAGKDFNDTLQKDFVWNDELEHFMSKDNPYIKSALTRAVKQMKGQDEDVSGLGIKFNAAGDVEYMKVPNMKTLDYIRRAISQEQHSLVKAGDGDGARILSGQLNTLKDAIGKSNKEYVPELAKQADYFQQNSAIELGKSIVQRLPREPRVVLRELADAPHKEHIRTGIVDSLLDMRNGRADPVTRLRNMLAAPDQRKVMEQVFDGKANLARFERWMRREGRAAKSDQMLAGSNSITSTISGADHDTLTGMSDLALAGSGIIAGNPSMGARGVLLYLGNRLKGRSDAAMNELAKILTSDGKDFAKGVRGVENFRKTRDVANKARVQAAGKAGQQLTTGYVGGQ